MSTHNSILHRRGYGFSLVAALLLLVGCGSEPILSSSEEPVEVPPGYASGCCNKPYKVRGKTYYPLASAAGYRETGKASWYGSESGNRTASGERFNPRGLTAAHKTLPIPCKVRVTNLRNGRHVDVVINDRGPFENHRLIDLSKAAAERIGMRGVGDVLVEYLGA